MKARLSAVQKWLDVVSAWKVLVGFVLLGLVTFAPGLGGGFQGDDGPQIVDNVAIHSFSNVGLLFRSGTFWDGANLSGDFYRPMMSTTFSLIYAFFGANPAAYHVVQLVLYVLAMFVLFLVLRRFFRSSNALLVAAICLVHPINSQVVYSIPCMQEPLFLLFGLLGLYLTIRARSAWMYSLAVFALFLSLLSKETGAAFVGISGLYMVMYRRAEIWQLLRLLIPMVLVYVGLRANAIGLFHPITQAAPIDKLGFWPRVLMIPSLLLFYAGKLLLPIDLATSYYWIYPTPTISGFVVPLLVLAALATIVGFYIIRIKKTNPDGLPRFIFFCIWGGICLVPVLQLASLDMTACETWVFASLPALLIIIASMVRWFIRRIPVTASDWLIVIPLLVIVILAQRTFLRGFDYTTQRSLSLVDVRVVPDNYLALNNLAKSYIDSGDLNTARGYATRSIAAFPAVSNYTNLGVIEQKQGNFDEARSVYVRSLQYGSAASTYENLGLIYLSTAKPHDTVVFLKEALGRYPRDGRLWTYLSVAYAQQKDANNAKAAIAQAASNGLNSPGLTYIINNEIPYDLPIPGLEKPLHIY